jgi:hypothetical protein
MQDDLQSGGIELQIRINRAEFGGKIIYQDEKITVVPCVLMAEGVQNDGLKQFEEFYDPEGLEGALWFEGVPIVREHPPVAVTHKTPKIGRIRNVEPDIENRRVKAEAVLFNDRLTPAEMKAIEKGEMLGGSIGYWCEEEPLDEPETWTDGTAYSHIEKAPFFGDHFALTADPACPVGVCGFNVDSNHDDCNCPKKITEEIKLTTEPEPGPEPAAGTQPVIEEKKPPAGDPKPPEGNAQPKPIEEPKKNALDAEALRIKAKTILEMSDDFAKRNEALALLMEIVTEESMPITQSKTPQKTVVEMDSKILDAINTLSAKIDSQNKEIEALKADKQTREAALKAEQEGLTKNSLRANFDQAYQLEFDKHWQEIQKNGINAFLANPDHAKHWDVKGDRKQISPVGVAFVQHNSDSEEAEFDAMGMPSEEDLSKKLGGGRA